MKSSRKVLFLDIDGVLQPTTNQYRFDHDMDALKEQLAKEYNEPAYLELDKYDVAAVYYDWDKNAVEELRILLEETGAEIVLSSDWRGSKNLEQMRLLFRIHDLDGYLTELLPRIKEFSDKPDDIPAYLEEHTDLYYYCVIDDRFMGDLFPGRFVYVGYGYRALDRQLREATATILNCGPWWDLGHKESHIADRWQFRNSQKVESPVIHDGIRKVIFLDFDGVVNDDLGIYGDGVAVHEEAIRYIGIIAARTGASIVFTSSRRLGYESYLTGHMREDHPAYEDFKTFNSLLKKYSLVIAGMTPIIESGPYARPAEIRTWLFHRPDVEGFVILDDDDFWVWDEMRDHFVRTVKPKVEDDEDNFGIEKYDRGLTGSHMDEAIEILEKMPMPKLKEPYVLREHFSDD